MKYFVFDKLILSSLLLIQTNKRDQERKERELKEQKEREERERLEKIRLFYGAKLVISFCYFNHLFNFIKSLQNCILLSTRNICQHNFVLLKLFSCNLFDEYLILKI